MLSFSLVTAVPVSATNYQVNPGGSIQTAINSAGANDIINVAAGIYVEDLTIPGSKTNLELVGATGAKIKGVQVGIGWPQFYPNIDIWADGVKIHGFTIQGPAAHIPGTNYSSGIVVYGDDVEIYDNDFEVNTTNQWNGTMSSAIQNNAMHSGDVSGLYIHDNTFTGIGTEIAGYEGIYINHIASNTPSGTVTIEDNTFGGNIFRAVTTERSKTTISGNSVITDLAPMTGAGSGSVRGIEVYTYDKVTQDAVSVTGNTVKGSASSKGFWQGIKIGNAGQTLTNISVTNNTVEMNTTGIRVYSSANGIVVNYNNISGNTAYGVDSIDAANILNATNNWWGNKRGPSRAMGKAKGHDNVKGDRVSPNVRFAPWLRAEV